MIETTPIRTALPFNEITKSSDSHRIFEKKKVHGHTMGLPLIT